MGMEIPDNNKLGLGILGNRIELLSRLLLLRLLWPYLADRVRVCLDQGPLRLIRTRCMNGDDFIVKLWLNVILTTLFYASAFFFPLLYFLLLYAYICVVDCTYESGTIRLTFHDKYN